MEQSGIKQYTEVLGMRIPNNISDEEIDQALLQVDKTYGSVLLPSKFRSTKHFTINTPLGATGKYNNVESNRDYIIIDDINTFLSSKYAYSVSYRDAYLDISHESLPISEKAIVLINDEKEFGITVHYVDEGIDTGDIILQRTYPIQDQDDYKTLLKRAYTGCAEILYDAVKEIQQGTVCVVKQDTIDRTGMYCGIRRPGDEVINWNTGSREIFNFVRALCKPGPIALSHLNGEEICINKVRLVEGAPVYINIPGQIIGKTKEGFYVKTKDTFIEVVDYQYQGKVRVGDRME